MIKTTHWDDIKRYDSSEGNVAKFVFEKNGCSGKPAVVEAVLYKYPSYEERTVICCSVQSGCPIGCRFCGAGDFFVRSLSDDEIVSQVQYCLEQTGIDPQQIKRLQVMTMSMGENFLNQTNVCSAFRTLNDLYPHAKLLISTSAPKVPFDEIIEVSKEIDNVGLQFSVHESTNEAREKLIPFKNKMSLEDIAEAGMKWHLATGRKPFFNYCASEVNSTDADADRLLALYDPAVWEATISVICERNEGMPVRNSYQYQLAQDFSEKLLSRGFNIRVFDPAGQDDVGGGCGQLHFVQQWFRNNPEHSKPSIGNGLPTVHTPVKDFEF